MKGLSSTSQSEFREERWRYVLFCFISSVSFFSSFTLVLAVCTPHFFVMESVWTFFHDSTQAHICAHNDLKALLNTVTLEIWV